jgi:AAA+ ATPase superfamily predicted ATPase
VTNDASDASLFPLGGPVQPEDLVGREAYIDALVRRLGSGQSLMIAAPRRLGKTSVVEEALRRLVDQGCYTARVDIFAVTSRAELAEELADRCLENRTRLRRSIQAVRSFARSAIGAFRPSVTIQDVELSLSLARESASENQILRDALSLPQRLAEHDRKRVIMAWDEFQEVTRLNSRDEDEVLRIMRAELQRQTSVSHVFLGSQEGMLRRIFGHTSQAFYRFASELPFPPAPRPEEWVPYLQRKYASRDVAISRSDAARLVASAGGHPLDTMLCANNVYQIALELGLSTITSTVVESAFERTMDELSRSFDELWIELGERTNARLVVRRLAMEQPVTSGGAGRRLHQQQAQMALAFLQRRGIIVREGRADYRFIEPMFAEYVRRLLVS